MDEVDEEEDGGELVMMLVDTVAVKMSRVLVIVMAVFSAFQIVCRQ